MRSQIKSFVHSQQFNPGPLGAFVNPFYLARRLLWREIAGSAKELSGRLLDVGCGAQPYRELFPGRKYIGLDIDTPRTRQLAVADTFYDGNAFPFEDATFDSVLCNQVLEHVFNPKSFLAEIRRVSKPNARLLLTVPFVWDEHEQPWDYARYSSYGLRALLEESGFRVIRQQKLMADFSILFQLTIAYLYKLTLSRSSKINLLVTAAIFGPLSILGLIASVVFPKNPDLFLDQLVIAEVIA